MKINILHSNDIHSHIDDLARAGHYIRQVREESETTLLLDAGDMITGEFQFKFNQGKAEQEINNYLKYDVVTLGNHDFDRGLAFLKEHMDQIHAPYVQSNLIDKEHLLGDYEPVIIKQIAEVKVAFVSFILPKIVHLVEEPQLFDYIDSSNYQGIIDELRKEGADLVIAINHQGITEDLELPKNVSGIDVIISSHSHTRLPQPEILNGTLIVQTGCFASHLGHLQLEVEEGKVTGFDYELVEVASIEKIDPDLQVIIDKYNAVAEAHASEVYGSCRHELEGRREILLKQSTDLGTLICDSYIDFAKEAGFAADFAMINSQGLRQSIPAGDITQRSLYNVIPFEKQLLVLEVKGADLLEAIEDPNNYVDLQTANLKIIRESQGKRTAFDGERGNLIDPEKVYRIATMNYIYEHHCFKSFQRGKVLAENMASDIEVVSRYIKKLGLNFEYKSNNMFESE